MFCFVQSVKSGAAVGTFFLGGGGGGGLLNLGGGGGGGGLVSTLMPVRCCLGLYVTANILPMQGQWKA